MNPDGPSIEAGCNCRFLPDKSKCVMCRRRFNNAGKQLWRDGRDLSEEVA